MNNIFSKSMVTSEVKPNFIFYELRNTRGEHVCVGFCDSNPDIDLEASLSQHNETLLRGVLRKSSRHVETPSTDQTKSKRIDEIIAELVDQVPEDEWNKVPSDLSYNLDHYLYGCEKK